MDKVTRAVLKSYVKVQAQKGGTTRRTIGELNILAKSCYSKARQMKQDKQRLPSQAFDPLLRQAQGLQDFLAGGTFNALGETTANISQSRLADVGRDMREGVKELRFAQSSLSVREQVSALGQAAFYFGSAGKELSLLLSYTAPKVPGSGF